VEWDDIIAAEEAALRDTQSRLASLVQAELNLGDFDREILDLRDQISESRAEDHAMLVEHMTRLASLRQLAGRGRVLPADPENPYFAHLRLREEGRVQDLYIGRRAVVEPKHGLHIVDWRNSPISRIYYRYEEGDEYEESFGGQTRTGFVEVRRTLTIEAGRLVRVRIGEQTRVRRDDGAWAEVAGHVGTLAGGVGTALRAPDERLGRRNLDQRLPEITALIDKAQFNAITTERSGVVVIRGGAGTGKTTIALHRAAWLHFKDPKRYAAKRMLMITPGEALARYVAGVLPTLDVAGVPIRKFGHWALETLRRISPRLGKRKLTDDTPSETRRLKRHAAMLKMLERAVQAEARAFDEVFERAGGEPLLRAWVQRRNLAPVPRVRALAQWAESAPEVAHERVDLLLALRQAETTLADPFETWASLLTDRDRLTEGFAAYGEKPYTWAIDQLVETVAKQSDSPPEYGHLDEDRRTGVDGHGLDHDDLTGKLDLDDVALLLRLIQLKHGQLTGPGGLVPPIEHLVVDEAQDFPPLALKVLMDAVRPGGPITLAGDTAQRIYFDRGFGDWDQLSRDLGIRPQILPPLAISYRSTRQVMALARHVLGPLQVNPLGRDARDGAPVELFRFSEQGEAVSFLAESLKNLRRRERKASVALLSRTPEIADLYFKALEAAEVSHLRRVSRENFDFSPGVDVTDIYQVKGLEYDYVVLLEVTAEQFPDHVESRHLLHVGATRAAHQLWLVCSSTPSPLLPETFETPED
jgi:DNA helicase-2/ATP-dependent DNA helicase PcrA